MHTFSPAYHLSRNLECKIIGPRNGRKKRFSVIGSDLKEDVFSRQSPSELTLRRKMSGQSALLRSRIYAPGGIALRAYGTAVTGLEPEFAVRRLTIIVNAWLPPGHGVESWRSQL